MSKNVTLKEDWTEKDEIIRRAIQSVTADDPDFWRDGDAKTDFSFLDTTPKPVFSKKFFWHPFTRVAAVLIVLLTVASGMAIWISTDPASAVKFNLEKKFYELTGKAGTSEEYDSIGNNNYINYETNTLEDIDKAKKILPELLVPGYIPEGFQLKTLWIRKDITEDFAAQYEFTAGEESTIKIQLHKLQEGESSDEAFSGQEIIELPDRNICVWKDEVTEEESVFVFMTGNMVIISGSVSKEELIEIGKSLNSDWK